jgi:hypothetical protein
MPTLGENITVGVARRMAIEQLVETLGGHIKLGRFLRVRFVYNQNGLPDVPDEMTLGEFRRLTAKGKTTIIVDDNEGGLRVEPKSPELV